MAVPHGYRFEIPFDVMFPLGLFLIGELQPLTEYRDKSLPVEFAAKVQPVPPSAVPCVPFTPVVLDGLTVQPRAETSGQAKWTTWVVCATGMRVVDAPASRSTRSAGDAKAA